jgi:hypothetical protein
MIISLFLFIPRPPTQGNGRGSGCPIYPFEFRRHPAAYPPIALDEHFLME